MWTIHRRASHPAFRAAAAHRRNGRAAGCAAGAVPVAEACCIASSAPKARSASSPNGGATPAKPPGPAITTASKATTGLRFWVFREGIYGGGTAAPLVFARAVRMSPISLRKSARYAELQAATNFSFLEGGSHPHELWPAPLSLGSTPSPLPDRNFASARRIVRGANSAAPRLALKEREAR